ncbi:MAG: hypothetical protein RLP44_13510 [Aggregatilineales bacterium]
MRHFADWKIDPVTIPVTQENKLASIKTHRQQTFRYIWLPVLILTFLLALLLIAILIPASPIYLGNDGHGLSIIADLFLTCFGLLPMLLCCGIVYVGLFAGVFGMSLAQRKSAQGLRRTQAFSRTMADKTADYADKASQQSIKMNARFAIFEPILRIFAPVDTESSQDDNDSGGKDVTLE